MNFALTEEQILIRNMVRDFAEAEVRPIASEIDKDHRFPAENIARMGELDLMGMTIPEEYGGSGGSFLAFALAVEELSRVSASHGVILVVHTEPMRAIIEFGTEEQKRKYIPDMASGKKIGCLCLTESGAGTDASAQKTTAVLDGDHYVLNGTKIFVTNGPVGGVYVIMAMTQPEKGVKGISAFIVERETPGLSVGQIEDKMGIRASQTSEVILTDLRIPRENLLGQEGEGFKIVMTVLDAGRVVIGAQALGLAQGAFEAAVEYIKERKQFGKPIAANQGIQWMIADMATRVDAARLLVYRAATLVDKADRTTRISKESAMAKMVASSTAMYVSSEAIQLHGGIGYTSSYPVERYLRDAKIMEIYEGTNQVMKMVISSSVLA